MARQKFVHFVPRDKPPKRKGVHKKSQNKSEKRQRNQNRYLGQGRPWKKLVKKQIKILLKLF